ncbi:MAG: response regulator transcription factor [Arcobacteraceae bacterium]|nr:response regulator transcription factor [Arcobacteraceae bacterium]
MNNEQLQQNLKTLTILYIEDEDEIRNNLLKTLEMIFKISYCASDANEAFLIYKEKSPDIILSDINLPNKSGIELVQEIRNTNHNIPIILLTAYTDTSILLDATKLNLINYLIKPIVFDELYDSFKLVVQELFNNNDNIKYFPQGIVYNIYKQELKDGKGIIRLTKSEQKLLDIFFQSLEKTISEEYIKTHLWSDAYDATDSAFKSVLNKLRKKIGKDSIKNVLGIGYYLNLQKK